MILIYPVQWVRVSKSAVQSGQLLQTPTSRARRGTMTPPSPARSLSPTPGEIFSGMARAEGSPPSSLHQQTQSKVQKCKGDHSRMLCNSGVAYVNTLLAHTGDLETLGEKLSNS